MTVKGMLVPATAAFCSVTLCAPAGSANAAAMAAKTNLFMMFPSPL